MQGETEIWLHMANTEAGMDELVERELTVPEGVEEVWRSLTEPEWLGEDAAIVAQQITEAYSTSSVGTSEMRHLDSPSGTAIPRRTASDQVGGRRSGGVADNRI